MGPRWSLGIVLFVVWYGSAAELKEFKYDQLRHQRRARQLDGNVDRCFKGTETPLGACPIKDAGEHPWMIRFKFDVDPKLGIPYFFHGHKALYDEYVKNLTAGKVGWEPNINTLMTGVLISTTRVLTTRVWKGMFEEMLFQHKGFFPRQFLWMYGYNFAENCHQGRHAKQAIWHPRAGRGYTLGILGDFGLYAPWEPFEVEGEPFLLQKPHPTEEIEHTITALIAHPEELLMYLFFNRTKDDGTLLSNEGSKFTFIGLPTCIEMPNFKLQNQVRFDPEATNASFFCGNGIPGSWNSSGNGTYEGRGGDGAVGAVAFYKDRTSGSLLPLGLYDYWIGTSGEPRFFAAFTKVFFDWIDVAVFPQPKTKYRENENGGRSGYIENPAPDIYDEPEETPPEKSRRRLPHFTMSPIAAFGPRRHSLDFWISAIAVLLST